MDGPIRAGGERLGDVRARACSLGEHCAAELEEEEEEGWFSLAAEGPVFGAVCRFTWVAVPSLDGGHALRCAGRYCAASAAVDTRWVVEMPCVTSRPMGVHKVLECVY